MCTQNYKACVICVYAFTTSSMKAPHKERAKAAYCPQVSSYRCTCKLVVIWTLTQMCDMKVYKYANIKFYWDKALKRTLRRHKNEHSASTGPLGFAALFSYNPPEYLWSDGLLHIMEESIHSRTVLTVPKCGWALETQLARTETGCIWKTYSRFWR